MVETTNITPATSPSTVSPGVPGGSYAPGPDFGTIAVAFIPVIIFAAVLYWGFQKKNRKKTTVEISYNLIAIEALLVVFLPLCRETASCALWAVLPVGMFMGLVAFIYHRKAKEREHKEAIKKAAVEGHIKTTVLVRETLNDDLKKTKEKLMSGSHRKELHAVDEVPKEQPKGVQKEKRWAMWKKEPKPEERKDATVQKPLAAGPSRKHWLAKYAESVIAKDKAAGKAGPSMKASTASESNRAAPVAKPASSHPSWHALERRPLAQLEHQAQREPAAARREVPSPQPEAQPQRREIAPIHQHKHREQPDNRAIGDLVKSVLDKKKTEPAGGGQKDTQSTM